MYVHVRVIVCAYPSGFTHHKIMQGTVRRCKGKWLRARRGKIFDGFLFGSQKYLLEDEMREGEKG